MLEDRMITYFLKLLESKTVFSRAELMETMRENGKPIIYYEGWLFYALRTW